MIELHGSILKMRCMRCAFTLDEWPDEDNPLCPTCERLLRPAVVWFGESLPAEALERAVQASRNCEVFFSVGTSGVVEPAASLPYEALRSGSIVVEINPIPTPLNVYTQYYFSKPSGEILPDLVSKVWGGI
jgi:NAD-dependent deacetylase